LGLFPITFVQNRLLPIYELPQLLPQKSSFPPQERHFDKNFIFIPDWRFCLHQSLAVGTICGIFPAADLPDWQRC
jgi:hypothetical protein